MDFFTHFLVPFIILFALKSKNKLEGAFGGIAPDFDTIFVAWIGFLVPFLFVFSHRGITHSFVFAAVASTLFLYIISRKQINSFIGKIIRRDISVEFTLKTVGIAYFGALTHLFLDFLTSRGIPLFYPFTLERFSAEIYYYIDITTAVIALIVLVVLYLTSDEKYKTLKHKRVWGPENLRFSREVAMAIFMIILISFGGIRAYEKSNALAENPVSENFTYSAAYPTMDMFTWTIVESNAKNSTYYSFSYNTINKEKSNEKTVQSLTVNGGSVQSAQKAINKADNLPEVQNFRWDAYYQCINASYDGNVWKLTYFDVIDTGYHNNNINVFIR
ncbi:MAG: metal-dependent hydrolase [Methanobacterium sp.]|uniref:metal-dependent hydrolase n=1 Tax=Methanobacterium sp. TaxID=2164 RepID=UPI003D6586FD|nr:metal-dependent hydrolase [Methanobacterium sp.]